MSWRCLSLGFEPFDSANIALLAAHESSDPDHGDMPSLMTSKYLENETGIAAFVSTWREA